MKQSLTTYETANALHGDKNAGLTRPEAYALAVYLEDLEEDLGEEMDLSLVAIRCDFSEYPSLHAWADDYFSDYEDFFRLTEESTEEERDDCIREFILDHGQLVEFSGGIIVSNF